MNGLTPNIQFNDDENYFDIVDISFSKSEGYFFIVIINHFYYFYSNFIKLIAAHNFLILNSFINTKFIIKNINHLQILTIYIYNLYSIKILDYKVISTPSWFNNI